MYIIQYSWLAIYVYMYIFDYRSKELHIQYRYLNIMDHYFSYNQGETFLLILYNSTHS